MAESFREVAERINIDKITIKDITDNCGYSSATFYRQFRDKYYLIAWDYTQELEGILSGMDGSKTEWRKALTCAAVFFQERKTYLSNLFLHTSGRESFITYMQEVDYQSLKDIVVRKAFGDRPIDPLIVQAPIYFDYGCNTTFIWTSQDVYHFEKYDAAITDDFMAHITVKIQITG